MFVYNEMTPHPITITPDRTIFEAQRLMKENNIRHLPVITPKGTLAGLVTRTSLDAALPSQLTTLSIWELNYQLNQIKVNEAMVRAADLVTVPEDTPIEQAARLMVEKKVGSLLVVRGDRLVGIITDIDLMRTLEELLGARQPGLRLTLKVPDSEGQLCKVTSAVAEKNGYISALGTYPSEDPLKWWVVLKVRFVNEDELLAVLKRTPEIEILDVREA